MIFSDVNLQKSMSEFYSAANSYEILISDLNEYHKQFREVNKGVIGAHLRVEFVNKFLDQGLNGDIKTADLNSPIDFQTILTKYRSVDETSSVLADQIMVTRVSILQIDYFINSYIDLIIEQIKVEIAK